MNPITIRYSFRPHKRSLATEEVADLFGLDGQEPPHIVADDVALEIRPGDLVLFTGPSGSGKSSLLRAVGAQLGALDANALELPAVPLVDALPGSIASRLDQLAACGLSEARLLLRTPAELSDGQRYRFRLAYAVSDCELRSADSKTKFSERESRTSDLHSNPQSAIRNPQFIMADEFAAMLDRTLAKVLAFNLRKLANRSGVGFLLATTHDDVADDLNPDLHVRCLGDGAIDAERRDIQKKRLIRERVLAVGRFPIRLAVFRSVALSQPSPRLYPPRRDALA
jgi:ABC-type ATPase with predicted acetyltransferase domain